MCPLCRKPPEAFCETSPGRTYFRCGLCDLVFLDPALRLSPEEEKKRYLEHDNRYDDSRYRGFLNRLWGPLSGRIRPGSRGLDYGSGPSPVLARIMREEGHEIAIYDPFFAPDTDALQERYDFIVCCETAEHFFTPEAEFRRLRSLLKPGGWLGIQTQMLDDRSRFPTWYYHRDPTHVCFFSETCFQWIAGVYDFRYQRVSEGVALLQAPQLPLQESV